jgi:hypothetical protein
MLIVEGPDGAGKSTLVERLSKDLDMYVMPKVVDKDTNPMVNLVQWVHDDVTSGLKRAMYDRHRLISEPIYGPVIRSRMEPGFDNPRWLREYQRKFRELEPFVIFCIPPIEAVLSNVDGDQDNIVVKEHIELIYWLYFNLAAIWATPTAVWDYTLNEDSYRGATRYDSLHSDVTDWLWKKGLYHGRG